MKHVRPTRVSTVARAACLILLVGTALLASGCGAEETAADAAAAAAGGTQQPVDTQPVAQPAVDPAATAPPGELVADTAPAPSPAPTTKAPPKTICLDECDDTRSTVVITKEAPKVETQTGATQAADKNTESATPPTGLKVTTPTTSKAPRSSIEACLDKISTSSPSPQQMTWGKGVEAWANEGKFMAWEFASSADASDFAQKVMAKSKGKFAVSSTLPGGYPAANSCIGL